jgi:hypothetical protein
MTGLCRANTIFHGRSGGHESTATTFANNRVLGRPCEGRDSEKDGGNPPRRALRGGLGRTRIFDVVVAVAADAVVVVVERGLPFF